MPLPQEAPAPSPKPLQPKAVEAPYRMPKVRVGDTVYWSPVDAGELGNVEAAIVTKVDAQSIECCVFTRGFHGARHTPTVPHVSDPRLGRPEMGKSGCWRHRPEE